MNAASTVDDIVIFGAGIGGGQTFDVLKRHGLDDKVKFFSDNNTSKIGKEYCGRLCILPKGVIKTTSRLIVISSTAYDVISAQLQNKMPEFTGRCFAFEAGEVIYSILVENIKNANYRFSVNFLM